MGGGRDRSQSTTQNRDALVAGAYIDTHQPAGPNIAVMPADHVGCLLRYDRPNEGEGPKRCLKIGLDLFDSGSCVHE